MKNENCFRYLEKALLVAVLILVARPAMAMGVEGDFGLSSATQFGGNSTTVTKSYTTYGLLAELPLLLPRTDLLIGILYAEMGGHQAFPLYDYDVKLPYYQIPVLLNFSLLSYLSIGGGVYYGIPTGNATETGTVAGVVSTSSSDTFSNLKWRGDDYGLVASARLKIPFGLIYFSGTVFYEYGLENVSTASGQSITNRSLLAMLGVGIGI